MGIISSIKQKISNWAEDKYNKVGDKVAALSKLSQQQTEDIEKLRTQYLSEVPSMDSAGVAELTARLIASSSVEVFNSYLPQIKDVYLVKEDNTKFEKDIRVRYFDVTRWVFDRRENNLEKLINVYEVLSEEDCNIGLIFNRTKESVKCYLAVTVTNEEKVDPTVVDGFSKLLASSIKGNFPGSEILVNKDGEGQKGTPDCLTAGNYSVASMSNIPSEKSEKFISQTMEKLLDGIVPTDKKGDDEYTIVLLATPVHDIEERKNRLAQIYTALSPYSAWQTNFTFTQSDSTNSLANFGVNAGMSAGLQYGHNLGVNNSNTHTDSKGNQSGSFESRTGHQGNAVKTLTRNFGGLLSLVPGGRLIRTGLEVASDLIGDKTKGKSHSETTGTSDSITSGNYSGSNNGIHAGANLGANFARSSSVTATIGKNEGITQSFTNYNIKHLLEYLESQMNRLDQSSALGMWDFAGYVLSKDSNTANSVAHTYLALTQGEDSYLTKSSINSWHNGYNDEESEEANEICSYVTTLRHPEFVLAKSVVDEDKTFLVYPLQVTPTTALSGKELAYSLNFPSKSVAGLPVLETASFGRNVSSYNLNGNKNDNDAKEICLGNIVHMYHEEKNIPVNLSLDSLCSHAFITGSTGSGKSNTVYQILSALKKENIKFMIIEPAKGEYKNVFGNDKNVKVYGTNPQLTDVLRINPFSFPDEIHILEHLDRLVEIFNVCWPMYAAMPAILKQAIEKSYEDAGWDLTTGKNKYDKNYYPTFEDVTRSIRNVINSSEYEGETRGNYKGSLLTRLSSLTNGINGQIFTTNEIEFEDLFDENVIIDLSRVGSQETKSLLMGIIVLKLQEYRMATGDMNSKLKHVTILEEAHNILRRTSTNQSSEIANLAGKSVEMLTNAIAEMRSYGEGFIIADQAPALLDMAVIRNTNTKIIMRLPDLGDRDLVGKAANLNDDQINELAKLPTGVAAVYQNEWSEAVLCKVTEFTEYKKDYRYKKEDDKINTAPDTKSVSTITKLLCENKKMTLKDEKIVDKLDISGTAKAKIIDMLKNPLTTQPAPRFTKLGEVLSCLYPETFKSVKRICDSNINRAELWTTAIRSELLAEIGENSLDVQLQNDVIQALITQYIFNDLGKSVEFREWQIHNGF
ncbi:ATP-binding protein [Treponema sp.]|uniref:ATP-binding protein n=1 Tax=Treponema sp. TaxID=166 RepID=UPI00389027E1